MADQIDDCEVVYPPISASKQNRINIWRTEVATANQSSDNASVASPSNDDSVAASSTTTSSTHGSRRGSIFTRSRHFFSSVARRLSGAKKPDATCADDDVVRTEMYTTLRPDYVPGSTDFSRLIADAEASLEGSGAERDAALVARQERLLRAAQLLKGKSKPTPDC